METTKSVKKQPGTEGYEKRLKEMKNDLLRLVDDKNNKVEIGEGDVGDEADQASLSSERELLFELSDNERTVLESIEAALRKIETHVYGLCEECRGEIAVPRLKAIPHARYCIQCQAKFDKPR